MKFIIIFMLSYTSVSLANSVETETDIQKFNKMSEKEGTEFLLEKSRAYLNGETIYNVKRTPQSESLSRKEYDSLKK